MCNRRIWNNWISNIHSCALKIYEDKISNFKGLLQKIKSVYIHMRYLQYFAIEIYQVKNSLSPKILMNGLFTFQESKIYVLRSSIHLG